MEVKEEEDEEEDGEEEEENDDIEINFFPCPIYTINIYFQERNIE